MTTTKTEALRDRIARYYDNARLDYGVTGECLFVKYESDALFICWEESDNKHLISFPREFTDTFTAEELFYIWMEEA